MICLKIHRAHRRIIALCDETLIGKRFEEGKRQLDLRENFYKESTVGKEEAIRIMKLQLKEDATFNIVGQESVQAAIEAGVVNPDYVDTIDNIPFILTLL